jgi:acetate kinase
MKTKLTLTVNAGSATLKLAVFDDKLKMIWSAQAEKIGLSGSFLVIKAGAKSERHEVKIKDHAQALVALISFLNPEIKVNIAKVGHRVVHGGSTYFRPTRLNTKVLKTIAALSPLARLHNPKNLAAIKAAQKLFPRAQHFGLFDTAFYHSLPPTAYLYALPLKYCRDYGVRKYGFHGLSHHYCLLQAAAQLKKPVRNSI